MTKEYALLQRGPGQDARGGIAHHWLVLATIANFGFWSANALHEWFVRGLFGVIGVDWARFWGASRAFHQVGPAAAYKLPEIASFMQPLVQYYRPSERVVRVGPAP